MLQFSQPWLATLTTRRGARFAAASVVGAGLVFSALVAGKDRALWIPPAEAQTPTPSAPQTSAAASVPSVDVSKSFSAEQRRAIEQVVREYLIGHPEVLVEISKELEQRQQAQLAETQKQTIVDKKSDIFKAPVDYVLGNANGNVAVVEFFDYNCAWCKRAVDEVSRLSKSDTNIRIVMKELPIFGDDSTYAAKAAMASVAQGKYWDFHLALMKEKRVTKENTLKIAEKVGLDVARLRRDMENPAFEQALKVNHELAQTLGIEGTPGFIVDTKVNVGYVPYDNLKELIADVRKAGCKVC